MPLAYKSGVRVQRRTLALSHMESCALATQAELGYPNVLMVTSVHDSRHVTGSRHYSDEALDWRTKGAFENTMRSRARKLRFRRRFAAILGDRFTVILEGNGKPYEHLHSQVKKGEHYP
jgi:hypothetical protein